MSIAVGAFLASIGAGAFGALVGIGGGLIIVPVLTELLGVPIKTAIAASLIGVIATSTGATSRYLSAGLADRRLGLMLLIPTVAGSITGSLLNKVLDANVLAGLFGLLLVFVAVQLLRQKKPSTSAPLPADEASDFVSTYTEPTDGTEIPYRARRIRFGLVSSFFAGNVSALLGIGGGVINVPTMTIAMGIPIRVATTTSTYMLGPTAVTSALIYFAAGVLDPILAGPVALGVFIGARAGARFSTRVSQAGLRLAFIGVALFFAVQMFARFIQNVSL